MNLRLCLRHGFLLPALMAVLLSSGCATTASVDYSAFDRARPASLLVLPPLNDSPELKGGPGIWAQATRPLAEAGYYVFPAALVNETFRQNGLQTAADIHAVPLDKLHAFFGADAVVYLHVKDYGSSFKGISSEIRVALDARIVDLRSGDELWKGEAVSASASGSQTNLLATLVTAIATQIIDSSTDRAFSYAASADNQLFDPTRVNGIRRGPRAPQDGSR